MNEGQMKDEWRIMKDEGWMMNDDDFKLLRGFADGRTDRQTNRRTFVIVESLSRLKKNKRLEIACIISIIIRKRFSNQHTIWRYSLRIDTWKVHESF